MCGIIGLMGGSPDILYEVVKKLSHRGPDDDGVFISSEDAVGLGHTRLSILDLSPLGHQPMLSPDKKVALVFNGEIYNFHELKSKLVGLGFKFNGNSDTEVLLNLYLAYGEQMLPLLNGIFALAIWDDRKKILLLARDAFGIKPLYYSLVKNHFAFASEIKALIKLLPKGLELDIASLHRYLSFLWCPGAGTPLKAVRKLGPGEAMLVVSGEIQRLWSWYEPPIFRGVNADLSFKDSLIGVDTHLRQAVHRQMVADVPVGAFLSGGLDSSAIVSYAREVNPDIHCFTIESRGGVEEGVTDDLPYARRVAHHLDVDLSVVSVDASRMAGDLQLMVAQLDEPLADPAALNVLYISQLAKAQGIKVLLSGAGGDDLFTGYRRHRAVQAEKYWRWLPLDLRGGLKNLSSQLNQRHTFSRRMAKLFSGATLDGNESLVEYFRWSKEADLLRLYTNEARLSLGGELAASPMLEFLAPLNDGHSSLEKMLALEQRFFLTDHNLLYTDKMSMAAGVEVRVPFLDQNLVDFSARIPLNFKQQGSVGKWILKKAMEPYLPRDVIYRPKSGFGAPLRRWMQHDLRELMGDLLSKDSLQKRQLFNPEAISRLISMNDAGTVDANYTLFSIMCIEIWCREYLD